MWGVENTLLIKHVISLTGGSRRNMNISLSKREIVKIQSTSLKGDVTVKYTCLV